MKQIERGRARYGRNITSLLRVTVCAVLTAVLATTARAAGEHEGELTPQQMQAGSLLWRMQTGYVVATRLDSEVNMRISGMVARVSLRQQFRNDGQQWLEGVYVFPLPDTAAVDHLRMHIGERFIEGEIREKEQAKKEYKQAKKQGKKASLVEQQRANLFTTSVANIAPGETVTVEIEYLEVLRYDEGTFSLRFPLTLTPRYIPGSAPVGRKGSGWSPDTALVDDASNITPPMIAESDHHTVRIFAEVNAGAPLTYIASRYHAIDVNDSDGTYTISLAGGDVPMDHDFELVWRPVPDASPRAMLFAETLADRKHLLLMMIPPNDASVATVVVARELVFVIDTSGSMHGASIEQAKKALLLALDGLRPVDRFSIIQFNSVTGAFLPGSVAATAANVNNAKRYVRALRANGGTEMHPALLQALQPDAPAGLLRQIIFITDGSVGNEEGLFSLISTQLGDTRLFTVGIGSAPNGWFMRKAAELGRGTYTYISALHEVQEKMERLFRKLAEPQVTDIEVMWPSSVEVQAFPETIPDLYAGEPIMVKARLQNTARVTDVITISGTSAMGGWVAELPLDAGDQSAGVAALWAREKIENTLDNARRRGVGEDAQQIATQTALQYHLVSKYTSLVAIDKTPVRPAGAALGKEQVPNLLPYGQSHNAIFGFPATATTATQHLLTGAACLFVALLLVCLRRRSRVSLAAA
jgi:Ca-activated chloride channel family protein